MEPIDKYYIGSLFHQTLIDEKTISAIEDIIARGDRVELIPVKDGVKVIRVRREEVKNAKEM